MCQNNVKLERTLYILKMWGTASKMAASVNSMDKGSDCRLRADSRNSVGEVTSLGGKEVVGDVTSLGGKTASRPDG